MEERAQVFAEEAIRALGRKDVPVARTAMAEAYDIDRKVGAIADAVYLACAELEEDNWVRTATWNMLADAVGPGPLLAVVESSRS